CDVQPDGLSTTRKPDAPGASTLRRLLLRAIFAPHPDVGFFGAAVGRNLSEHRERSRSERQRRIVAEAQLRHPLERQRSRDPAAQERRSTLEARLMLLDAVLARLDVERAPEHERLGKVGL